MLMVDRRQTLEHMVRPASHADDHACVLDRKISIQEQWAARSHVFAERVLDEANQPIRSDGLSVVIQEYEHVSGGFSRGEIIESGPVKRRIRGNDGHAVVTLLFIQPCQRGRLSASVVDHYDLVVHTLRNRTYGLDACLQELKPIAGGNDEACFSSGQKREANVIAEGERTILDPGPGIAAGNKRLDGRSSRVVGIWLGVRIG